MCRQAVRQAFCATCSLSEKEKRIFNGLLSKQKFEVEIYIL